MKKTYLSLIATVFAINFSYAQYWAGGPTGPIYYNGGNVGIGTSSPVNTLDVNGGINTNGLSSVNDVTFNTAFTYYKQVQAVGYNLNILSGDGASLLFLPYTSTGAYARFQNYGLVIDGNVGIGTSTPVAKLSIVTSSSDNPLSFQANTGGAWTVGPNVGAVSGDDTFGIYSYTFGPGHSSYPLIQFNASSGNTFLNPNGGNVLVGKTSQTNTGYILDIAGYARANEVVVNTTGADFVFKPSYKLNPLSSLKKYIDKNHHLPEIPSAREMQENGLNLGENQTKLLQKVEELTLYFIEKDKQVNTLQTEIKQLKQSQQKEIDELKKQVSTLIQPKP